MKKFISFFSLILILNSCTQDDDITQNLNGTYSGIFTVKYSDDTTHSNSVTVNFSGMNKYISSGNGNTNDFFPAGGSGTYKIEDSKIIFSDTNAWLANFDWNLILNGEYNFSMNQNQLIISANKNNVGFYKYELKKE